MPYLIDGHNLIPRVGLRLDAVDDELELIAILQEHGRRSQLNIEVYFDGAPAGTDGTRKYGRVTAVFVRKTSTADAAIRQRLRQLAGEARNWTVVTSDREVLRDAKAAHARTKTSQEFAAQLKSRQAGTATSGATHRSGDVPDGLSKDEVDHWMDEFKKKGK